MLFDSVNLTDSWGSTIQANAFPLAEKAKDAPYRMVGGSGGYVYIKTGNSYNQNAIGERFRVEAKGGNGANGSFGGSGGVIIFDGGFDVRTEQVTAAGGAAYNTEINIDGCGNGAAGTLYYKNHSKLVIDNENKLTPKKTIVQAKHILQKNKHTPSVIAKHILIDGGADVYIANNHNNWLQVYDLELTEGTTLGVVTSDPDNFTLSMGGRISLADTSFVDLSKINNVNMNATNWWTTYSIGNIMFGHILRLSGGYVTINGNINVTDRNYKSRYDSKLIANVEMLTLTGNAVVESSFFFAHSRGPINIERGFNITSIISNTCSAEYHVPKMFSCVPHKSLQTSITYESFM
jgi:hypothetical protein